jgi:hypothetical protein
MSTTSRKDLDDEFAAWLAMVQEGQAPAAKLDALYRANAEAKAVKDVRPPSGDAVHAAVDRALRDMGY